MGGSAKKSDLATGDLNRLRLGWRPCTVGSGD